MSLEILLPTESGTDFVRIGNGVCAEAMAAKLAMLRRVKYMIADWSFLLEVQSRN